MSKIERGLALVILLTAVGSGCSARVAVPDDVGSPGATSAASIAAETPQSDGFDTHGFSLISDGPEDWAAYSDGYVFSDVPQSVGEQYIFDNYPDLWSQGIRVLSGKYVKGYNASDPLTYGSVIQYIDGQRYEGTDSMPLGFRGQDPDVMPMDAYTNLINADLSGTWATEGNVGQGGYTVGFNVAVNGTVSASLYNDAVQNASSRVASQSFGSMDEMIAAITSGSAFPDAGRALYQGEIATISGIIQTNTPGELDESVIYDPSSASFTHWG